MNINYTLSVPRAVFVKATADKELTGKSVREAMKEIILAEPIKTPNLTLGQIVQSALRPPLPSREIVNVVITLTPAEARRLSKNVEKTGLERSQFAWKQLTGEDYRLLTEKTPLQKRVKRLAHLIETKQVK